MRVLSMNDYDEMYKEIHYDIIQELIERHFDIFGLIEKGLAIDINTLEDAN